jgi:hypothetical protein
MSFGVGFTGSALASGFAALAASGIAGAGVLAGLTSAWEGSGGLDSDGLGGASLCFGTAGAASEGVGASGAASVFGFPAGASPLGAASGFTAA